MTIFVAGYFGAYFVDVVSSTLAGRDEAPDWPSFSDFQEDIASPLIRFIGLVLISFGPFLAIRMWIEPASSWYGYSLLLSGILGGPYFPIAVLATTVSDTLVAALPHVVIPAFLRIGPEYLVSNAVWMAGTSSLFFLLTQCLKIPWVGGALAGAMSVFGLLFVSRLIGLMYRRHRSRLGWE